jgi:hypothetical protein
MATKSLCQATNSKDGQECSKDGQECSKDGQECPSYIARMPNGLSVCTLETLHRLFSTLVEQRFCPSYWVAGQRPSCDT